MVNVWLIYDYHGLFTGCPARHGGYPYDSGNLQPCLTGESSSQAPDGDIIRNGRGQFFGESWRVVGQVSGEATGINIEATEFQLFTGKN